MTPERLQEIRNAQQFVFIELPQKQHDELQSAKLKLMLLKSECDHTYPNGQTANTGGQCRICNSVILNPMRGTLKLTGD